MNLGAPHLLLEILLDLVMAGLGIVLIVRAQDNRLRQIWGLLVVTLALSMIRDNYYWLTHEEAIIRSCLTRLSLPVMIKWYLFIHVLSLFTIGSLRPSWVSPARIIALSLPVILACTVAFCYLEFNGSLTPLRSLADIAANVSRTDVQLRLGFFFLSIFTPLLTVFIPLARRIPRRRLSQGMHIYIACILLLTFAYILFSLAVNRWAIYAFGYIAALLPSGLSILYLRNENPFSLPRTADDSSVLPDDSDDIVSSKLYRMIDALMKTDAPFTDSNYSLRQLMQQIGASGTLTTRAIKYGGFTGFHEYINFLRLEHFKLLADRMPGATIKELMFRCGFTSRSSFYRHFAEQESMSPREYLEKRGGIAANEQTTL